jgi:DNA-binding response OmpR family regulator
VVVSDWRVPEIDGLQLCRKIRERGGDYVYFILISSLKVTRERQNEALIAGVDDFLRKPVDPDELGMRLHVAERIIGFTNQVKKLESILPICGYCKKVRNDEKYWQEIEDYYAKHQGTRFSHGICPDCYKRVMVPQLEKLGIDPSVDL